MYQAVCRTPEACRLGLGACDRLLSLSGSGTVLVLPWSELLCCLLGWHLSIACKATWCWNFGRNPACIVEKVASISSCCQPIISVEYLLTGICVDIPIKDILIPSHWAVFSAPVLPHGGITPWVKFLYISCGSCQSVRYSGPSSILLSNSFPPWIWMTFFLPTLIHCFIRIWFLDDFSSLWLSQLSSFWLSLPCCLIFKMCTWINEYVCVLD